MKGARWLLTAIFFPWSLAFWLGYDAGYRAAKREQVVRRP